MAKTMQRATLSVAIRGERGSYNLYSCSAPGRLECSYPG